MMYTRFTKKLLNAIKNSCETVLLLAPHTPLNLINYKDHVWYISGTYYNLNIYIPTIDFFEFNNKWLQDPRLFQFDCIIGLRIFEHIPIRDVDFFLYQLANLLEYDGELHLVVPDMQATARRLIHLSKELANGTSENAFLFNRLCFEMFNEGQHRYDMHSIWTDEYSMRYLLEREKLFVVDKIDIVDIDSMACNLYVQAHVVR